MDSIFISNLLQKIWEIWVGFQTKNLNLPPRYQEGQCLSRQRGTRTYGSHRKALEMT
jgi:hypothetical protein